MLNSPPLEGWRRRRRGGVFVGATIGRPKGNKMIDLHMHTKYSDGTDSVIEILQKAEAAGLELISITDHDDVSAYFELQNIDVKKYFSGEIIAGTELKTFYDGFILEILGYGINPQRIHNSEHIKSRPLLVKQKERLEQQKELGKRLGLKFDEDICVDEKNVFCAEHFRKSRRSNY